MILQTHPRLIPEIRTDGCYFMCLLWYANKYEGCLLSPDVINELFGHFVHIHWLHVDCAVLNPQEILRHLGVDCRYTDRHEPAIRACWPNEFEILRWEYDGKSHFTAGEGRGRVTYDPMGCSKTAKLGRLADKRIFVLGA